MLWCEQTSRICSRFFTAKQGSTYRESNLFLLQFYDCWFFLQARMERLPVFNIVI